jgi:hypothetical protein
MKKNLLIGTMALLAGSLLAADSSPKDDIIAAAKKLADGGNYSWKTTMDLGPNSQFTPGPTEGKMDKDGSTWLSSSFQDNTLEGLMNGTNHVVVKTEEGWKTAAELGGGGGGGGGGGFNMNTFMVRRLQTLKAPAVDIQELAGKVKELKKDGDVYSGDLTEAGAQSLLTTGFGGRRGGQAPPPPKDAKGTVKFWVKDGVVTKYQSKVTGKTTNFQGEEQDSERTTTVEIKDVGTTKISAPDEAKKKLS